MLAQFAIPYIITSLGMEYALRCGADNGGLYGGHLGCVAFRISRVISCDLELFPSVN